MPADRPGRVRTGVAAGGPGADDRAFAGATAVAARRAASHAAYPPGARVAPPLPSSTSASSTVRSRKARSWLTVINAAGPVLAEVLQHAEGIEVEIVGRLVEEQHVGSLGQHQQQLQPPPLAARKEADGGELGVAVKPKSFEEGGVLRRGRVRGGDGVAHALGRVERRTGLVVVPEPHGRPALETTVGGLVAAGDEVEQRRLAAAVGADDAEALTGVDGQVEALEEQGPVAPSMTDTVEFDDLVAQAGCSEGQVELPDAGGIFGPTRHDGSGRSDAGLGLSRTGRCAPPEPGQLARREVAPNRFGDDSALLALGAGLEVRRVAAFMHVAAAPVEFEDAGGDPVEHMTIVGYEQKPAPVIGETVLEPRDGLDVEVVGGLVEHEQVGLVDEKPGEGHPLRLTAGQGGHVGVDQWPHAQAFEDSLRLPPVAHSRANRARRKVGPLFEKPDPSPPTCPHRPRLGHLDAGQHPEQSGLPGAVEPDDADAVTR